MIFRFSRKAYGIVFTMACLAFISGPSVSSEEEMSEVDRSITFGGHTSVMSGVSIANQCFIATKEVTISDTFSDVLVIDFSSVPAGAKIAFSVYGNWANHDDVFFLGQYYVSADPGMSTELYPPIVRFGTYSGNDTILYELGSPSATQKSIRLKTFDFGDGFTGGSNSFTGILAYEVISNKIASVS